MRIKKRAATAVLGNDPLWYKDAIIYEVHVRAFNDSNADGIGDFRGLVERLDYLQDLGVTTLWLLPFYPSPLRDDGYDIADYTDINSMYGTLSEFKLFMREAHRRGLRVITELVINHTSDQHPWFKRARESPAGTSWRDFYVWSDTAEKFKEARIIFSDFEPSNWTWDPVAKAYYWHRFYSHQPDLNFDNPAVHEAVLSALDFWLNLGIDGFRLDAVPYLYEREGTNCENLPETHAFLKKLRRHVEEKYRGRMLLAEANQWPEDAVAYFGNNGDECNMAFHFPLMPRLFMAIRMEDRFPILEILAQTPAIPETSQWALFLRNHDELTLEMVTTEDRDYMYRVYAQDARARVNLGIRRRLAPLLENHRSKIELMNGLLFSLPGTPVIYYGDEIGMGDNVYLGDRNGVRTPMQWTPERNAGFSQANPQRLFLPVIIDPEYHYQSVNVEAQQNNPHSLLWWMKRLIALRKRHQAFGRGTIEFLSPKNHKVLVFLRRYHEEQILVVVNLSRFVQFVELDLAALKGLVPVEMLGQTSLPPIGDLPYLLTLGPYAFYWLHLQPNFAAQPFLTTEREFPTLEVTESWEGVFRNQARENLESILLLYLRGQYWFRSKGGQPKSARVIEQIPIPCNLSTVFFTLVQVEYAEGEPRIFALPLAFAADPQGMVVQSATPNAVICRLQIKGTRAGTESQSGSLYDPLGEKKFMTVMLDAFGRHRRFRGTVGDLLAWPIRVFPVLYNVTDPSSEPMLLDGEHSNTSVAYGDRLLLKVFRCVEEGINPEIEISSVLAEKTSFTHSAPVIGSLKYQSGQRQPITVAALLGFLPNAGDAWSFTLDSLRDFFMRVLTQSPQGKPSLPARPFLDLVAEELPTNVRELIGPYLEMVRLMGRRTAEFHVALASITDDPDFSPEPFTFLYQRSLYQTVRTWVSRVFDLLLDQMHHLPAEARKEAEMVLLRETDLVAHLREIMDRKITAQRIRCHGDYRLEELLHTGKDFVLIDFEGQVQRPLSNRRHKRSPLRDVASLLHSLYSASRTALKEGDVRPEDLSVLTPWARFWHLWSSVAFIKAYLEIASTASFLPRTREEMQTLVKFYYMGRCVFELRYQLLNRPDRVQISLQALLHQLELEDRRRALIIEHPAKKVAVADDKVTR